MAHVTGFTRITATQTINEGGTILCGYHIEPSSANPRFSIYEGLDENSGRLILTSTDYDVYTVGQQLTNPILCDRGLHVVITSGVTAITLHWLPYQGMPL